jgi:hypothetical protein
MKLFATLARVAENYLFQLKSLNCRELEKLEQMPTGRFNTLTSMPQKRNGISISGKSKIFYILFG